MKELSTHSSFISAPSFSQLLKLYSAYNFGGRKLAGALASTLLIDQVVSTKFAVTKNYASLSGFWGYIAYKAISQIIESNKVDVKYKPLLYLLFSGISVGMVCLGKDIFADKHDTNKMLKSIALTSGFFDENGTISGLEAAYNKSYLSGIKYTITHLKEIITNKFIIHTLGQQGLDIAKLFLMEKFFQAPLFDKISILLAIKQGNAFEKITKLASTFFAGQVVEIVHQKLTDKLTRDIKKDINLKIATLAFCDKKTAIVMKLDNINQISQQMSTTYSNASVDLSSIIRDLLLPIISVKDN